MLVSKEGSPRLSRFESTLTFHRQYQPPTRRTARRTALSYPARHERETYIGVPRQRSTSIRAPWYAVCAGMRYTWYAVKTGAVVRHPLSAWAAPWLRPRKRSYLMASVRDGG